MNIAGGTWSPYVAPHQSPGLCKPVGGTLPLGGSNTWWCRVVDIDDATTTSTQPARPLGGHEKSGKRQGRKGSSAGGPTTATVLTSDRQRPAAGRLWPAPSSPSTLGPELWPTACCSCAVADSSMSCRRRIRYRTCSADPAAPGSGLIPPPGSGHLGLRGMPRTLIPPRCDRRRVFCSARGGVRRPRG